ncbi:hypothetical protein DRN86_02725 [Candidatus Geothermarchaeota archaeon]|nr:MAG: hypothetical protein DRN86_02725 [Candidatus Geothermarchaeota archaeon]
MKNEFKLPRLRPLDLSREIYAPHRKLYGFALRVKNKPGVLFRITKVLAELRINILGFSASTLRPEAEEAVIVLLTDCGRIIKPCDKVLKDLRSLEGVIDAEGIEPNKFGALFDVVHFPLQVHGERGVIFCEPILRGMIEVMRRQIGPGMNAILWKAGYYGGAEVAKEFEERYKLKSPEDQFEMLKFKAVALGWFIITDISISKKTA